MHSYNANMKGVDQADQNIREELIENKALNYWKGQVFPFLGIWDRLCPIFFFSKITIISSRKTQAI